MGSSDRSSIAYLWASGERMTHVLCPGTSDSMSTPLIGDDSVKSPYVYTVYKQLRTSEHGLLSSQPWHFRLGLRRASFLFRAVLLAGNGWRGRGSIPMHLHARWHTCCWCGLSSGKCWVSRGVFLTGPAPHRPPLNVPLPGCFPCPIWFTTHHSS